MGEPAAMVRFRDGSASLTDSARQQVRQIAQMYRKRGGGVRVEGHASSRSSSAFFFSERELAASVTME